MNVIITNINPKDLESQTYSGQDINLISVETTSSLFNPEKNYIEYTIISSNGSFQITDQDYKNYKIINDFSPSNNGIIYSIDFNPEEDIISKGFTNGEYNVLYKFLNNELSSSSDNRVYYVKEISSDRTEIKIASNTITNENIQLFFDIFKNKLEENNFFQDFYLNFGNNELIISNNIAINYGEQYELLINLYEPLPNNVRLKDTLWVVTQVADPLAFNIKFQPEVIVPVIPSSNIKGPNFNISIKDRINNSSNYINYEELLNTNLITSYQQINSYLQDKSINISINYSNFSDFIHFSSAKSRIENFYSKIKLIEKYNSDISNLVNTVSSSISESVFILEEKINNIINNFDGYEYWMYFSSGSSTYPKGNNNPPYNLLYSEDSIVITWYQNIIESASIFDQNNQNYIVNTIPEYLRDDERNEPYKRFVDMIGHFYDNIWIYYKDVTNKYSGDNRLNYGISKDLVAEALKSFGLKIYQNNFSTNDLYSAFVGVNTQISGSENELFNNGNVYVTSSYIIEGEYGYFEDDYIFNPGFSELITNYITASQTSLYDPIDDVNKEIYKRLYHNLPLLLKQKGTVAGLRNLINVYGIPDTILKISEFGGRDKDTLTYDYFQNQYNYALRFQEQDIISTFWELNDNWSSSVYNNSPKTPETIQFRFKPTNIKNQTSFSQSLWIGSTTGECAAVLLTYSGSLDSGSYSGSILPTEYNYARLDFFPDSNTLNESASIYLPFYNGDWWSVMISRDSIDTFTLYVGSKLSYDGFDGNQIGFIASSSVTSSNTKWGEFEISKFGDRSSTFFPIEYWYYSGSFQEIRYYTKPLNVNNFKDYVMNPNSVNISDEDYSEYLVFRASLGGELFTGSISIHPKITGSWAVTQSFNNDTSEFLISNNSGNGLPNIETIFSNSPITGLKDRVTDKVQILNQKFSQINLEFTQSGNILSQYVSIEKDRNIFTPNINSLEVAFSPQNEIDDDIISSLGKFNIGDYIGDPRQSTSSDTYYPDLKKLSEEYFSKYFSNYQLYDYIRLIRFFDNSLFKMIKDFTPARTNLKSGVIIKSHLLERNKYPQPKLFWDNVTYTGSIETAFFTGSTGGTFNEFNKLVNISGSILSKGNDIVIGYNVYKNIFDNTFPIQYGNDIKNSYISVTEDKKIIFNYDNNSNFDFFINLVGASTTYNFILSSSLKGYIDNFSYTTVGINTLYSHSMNNVDINLGEIIEIQLSASSNLSGVSNASISVFSPSASIQLWEEIKLGPSGSTKYLREDQREFYNGEFYNNEIIISDGELNKNNMFKYPSVLEIDYDVVLYKSNITPLDSFLNINTSPNQGQIYLWWDSGSSIIVTQNTPGGR